MTHPFGGGPSRPSLPQLVIELKDLLIAYLRQETVVPLKQLGRYLALGIAGSLLMGVGVILWALGPRSRYERACRARRSLRLA